MKIKDCIKLRKLDDNKYILPFVIGKGAYARKIELELSEKAIKK